MKMYELGQKLRITYYPPHLMKTLVTKVGQVIYTNEYYYTVQFENFRESFRYADKDIIVEVVENEHKRVG